MMLHRFSMGFKSGENGGHTMTRPFLKQIFCRSVLPVVLAACDWALSCIKIVFLFSDKKVLIWTTVRDAPSRKQRMRQNSFSHLQEVNIGQPAHYQWSQPKTCHLHIVVVWHEWDGRFHLRLKLYSTYQARQALLHIRLWRVILWNLISRILKHNSYVFPCV